MKETIYVGSVPTEIAQLVIEAMKKRAHNLIDEEKFKEAKDLLYELEDIMKEYKQVMEGENHEETV